MEYNKHEQVLMEQRERQDSFLSGIIREDLNKKITFEMSFMGLYITERTRIQGKIEYS